MPAELIENAFRCVTLTKQQRVALGAVAFSLAVLKTLEAPHCQRCMPSVNGSMSLHVAGPGSDCTSDSSAEVGTNKAFAHCAECSLMNHIKKTTEALAIDDQAVPQLHSTTAQLAGVRLLRLLGIVYSVSDAPCEE
jgi:hypothetical protein